MKPKVRLSRRINYVMEACHLLESVAELKKERKYYDFRGIQKVYFQKFGISLEQTEKNIEFAEKLVLETAEVMKEDMTSIQKYFMPGVDLPAMEQRICCVNMGILGEDSDDNGGGMLKDYQKMTEQERDVRFVSAINETIDEEQLQKLTGCEEKGIVYTDVERIRNILSYIQKMELSAEKKEELWDSYLNRDVYVVEIAELLDKAIAVLKEHEPEILKIVDSWEQYWRGTEAFEEVQRLAESIHGQADLKEIWVAPGVMHGAWLQLAVREETLIGQRGVPILWRLGVNMAKEYLWHSSGEVKEEYQPEEYQRILKLLGDKSKFDILMFVKEKPAYGTEIAQHFGLTTATVSHHMSQLMANRLVDMEIREKRVYYKTRKEELQKFFEKCKKLFE